MKKIFASLMLVFAFFSAQWGGDDARLLRFPDINGDQVAFVYAGDIWTVSASGGEARRLTSHPGIELFPKISPDGKWIAFSAEYSGSRQVYVMPASGGSPRQLTYYNDVGILPPRGGTDYVIMDWTPDSQKILVRCNRTPWGERMGKYFLVSPAGGLETPLQIPEAGGGTFSPDASQIVYTPIEREFRTWKRYQGGRAQDIWIYDLKNNRSRKLTDFPGTDQHPIWFGNTVYYVSDRNLTLNIFAHDLGSGESRQITRHDEYDVLWPSGRDGMIVYENGGRIYKLDVNAGKTEKLTVNLHFDNPNAMPVTRNVGDFILNFDISPSGKRAVFEARGDLYTVPEKEGITVNLTDTQGVREMAPAWSPDGSRIVYYSDATGEYEIYLQDKEGAGKPQQLTSNSRIWRYPPKWSPDGRMLLFSDKNQLLQILDVASQKITVADKARRFDITDYSWSHDSRWIAYTKDGDNGQNAVWVYSLDQGKASQLTDASFGDFSPVFSPDGRYLYFLSNRDFNLVFSSYDDNYLYNKATRIYALALTPEAPILFKDKNDVEAGKSPAAAKAEKTPAKKEEKKAALTIDFSGSSQRVVAFPVPAGDIQALVPTADGVLYFGDGALHHYNIEERKDALIIAGITGGALSADGKKILYQAQNKCGIIEVRPDQKVGDGALNLDHLTMRIEPLKEWQQIFNDGWRIFRDWFYVKNMHGVDWEKMKLRYGQFVPHLGHRADLDFIFGELVGEVNAGHCYVDWGEFARVPRIDTGLLGAELKADEASGRYVIAKIYRGENWNEDTRSPLTEQDVRVKVGDYLIALNGHEVTAKDNPYRFLENTVGKRIAIMVNGAPQAAGAREYWIKPIRSEQKLFYMDWVDSRRAMVDKLSGGRVGYLHLPNTAERGNLELFKGLYALGDKEALIIDVRYNGGGFIPSVMNNALARRILNYWSPRGVLPVQTPPVAYDGPKAMLINGYSSSGGDALPYYFRKSKLGTLIGTRTWGGLVGLSGNPGFVDGGNINVPTFGFVDTDGKWAVEGEGVSPDIEVVDLPEEIAKGRDPSVEKAVAVLLKELEKNPPKKVNTPAEPDRSKWIEKK